MRALSKTYTALMCGAFILASPIVLGAQTATTDANQQTCAALLSNDSSVGTRLGPGLGDSTAGDRSARVRADSAAFGIGAARSGKPNVYLFVGVRADEVRFAKQPNVRVRLCWGGDTLRVVQRTNLPSPVAAGTTYRNVYVAVELIGRLNGECLANAIGVGTQQAPRAAAGQSASTQQSASNCAFLGGAAGAGQANPRPPNQ
jgi:hypothetical protein